MASTGFKIFLAVVGLSAIGGGVAYAASRMRAPALVDKGFTILPNCAGIKVTSEAAALKWVRQQAALSNTTNGPVVFIEPYQLKIPGIARILGDCVKTMTPEQYAQVFTGSHRFLYDLMVNWLDGQVRAGRKDAQKAREALQAYRDMLVAANVDVAALQPLPDALFIQPLQTLKPGYSALFDLPAGMKGSALLQVPADQPAPLVIVLHGRQGTEKQLRPFIPTDLGAHVVFLRGPLLSAPGFLFFKPRLADKETVLVPAMRKSLEELFEVIETLRAKYATTRVIVLGGSQGGALAYLLAAAGLVDGAVSVSGSLPPGLHPIGASKVDVVGIHGTADKTVPAAKGQSTIEAFTAAGYPSPEWIPIDKGTHALGQAAPLAHDALRKLAGKDVA